MEHAFSMLLPQVSFGDLFSRTVPRLVLAALLGGLIGLERELKRRPAGLRTNMFICFGAAMFTILSEDLAGKFIGDHTRIAAQIIPGIGFIGAGSILHAKNGVAGLTTAATVFVVASIGMACGGGLYLPAIFATLLILLALLILGWMEGWLSLKPEIVNYTVISEKPSEDLLAELNACVEDCEVTLQKMHVAKINGKKKLSFSIDGTRHEQKALVERLKQSPDLKAFESERGFNLEHE